MDEIKEGAVIKREMSTKVKEIGVSGSRILEFVASTETPDRSNDIIEVGGWKLDNWNKNPVFPIFHDYFRLPVGKGMSATKDARNRALVIRVYFPTITELCSDPAHPSDEALFVDTVYNMYKQGMLNAVSVGFKPIKYKTRDDDSVLDKPEWQRGYRFIETELLEVSAVLVPCNPDALVSMRGVKGYTDRGLELVEKEMIKSKTPEGDKSKTAEEHESLFGEEEDVDVDEKTLKALEERVLKRLGDKEVKAGSKFSKETREALSKVVEAMDASHKAIRACSKTLASMLADPAEEKPAEEKPAEEDDEEEGKGSGDSVKKTVEEVVKELDFATVSLEDVAKMFKA